MSTDLKGSSRLSPVIYSDLDPGMYGAAARSLLATVECLLHEKKLILESDSHDDHHRYVLNLQN